MTSKWIFTPIVLALIAAASYAVVIVLRPPELPEGIVYGNGHIEGLEVRVSAEVPGRVLSTTMPEGEVVEQGAVLATLDDADVRKKLARAEAEVRAVEQQRARTERELETWRHHLSTAEDNLERIQGLRDEDIVPQQQLDAAQDRYREAQGRVEGLEAAMAEIAAKLEAAQSDVELLQVQLEKKTVDAPLTATVLVKAVAVEEGEYVTPGQPVAVLVDLREMKLKVYIPEQEAGKIKLGDPARVRVDAFPDRYFEARVTQIDQEAQFTPKDIHVPAERTRMVFGVELSLDNPERVLKPGMPADAWIRWQQAVPWPDTLPVPQR